MNIQNEIIMACAVTTEGMAAILGITCIWRRLYMFACACVYALRALAMLFRSWGLR